MSVFFSHPGEKRAQRISGVEQANFRTETGQLFLHHDVH